METLHFISNGEDPYPKERTESDEYVSNFQLDNCLLNKGMVGSFWSNA